MTSKLQSHHGRCKPRASRPPSTPEAALQGPGSHPAQRVPASGLAASGDSPPSRATGRDPTPRRRPRRTAPQLWHGAARLGLKLHKPGSVRRGVALPRGPRGSPDRSGLLNRESGRGSSKGAALRCGRGIGLGLGGFCSSGFPHGLAFTAWGCNLQLRRIRKDPLLSCFELHFPEPFAARDLCSPK